MNLNASEETPYFSKKAIMIGGRTKIGNGRATRVSAVSISAWKKLLYKFKVTMLSRSRSGKDAGDER